MRRRIRIAATIDYEASFYANPGMPELAADLADAVADTVAEAVEAAVNSTEPVKAHGKDDHATFVVHATHPEVEA